MRPLAEIVHPFGIKIITYVDDTQLVVALNHPERSSSTLGCCLEEVARWMELSCLKLNGVKTELILLGNSPSFNSALLWPNCLGPAPILKDQIKSLGIWLDHSLTFNHQAAKLSATCFGLLRMLRKNLPLLPFQARRIMVQALIISCLDYGNLLYLGAPHYTINKLQIIHNCAARLLLQIPHRQSTKPALETLHWLPIRERIQFKAMCLAHKAFWKNGPAVIQSLITPYQPRRDLRSTAAFLSSPPRIRRVRYGGRSFSYNAAILWNALPLHL